MHQQIISRHFYVHRLSILCINSSQIVINSEFSLVFVSIADSSEDIFSSLFSNLALVADSSFSRASLVFLASVFILN